MCFCWTLKYYRFFISVYCTMKTAHVIKIHIFFIQSFAREKLHYFLWLVYRKSVLLLWVNKKIIPYLWKTWTWFILLLEKTIRFSLYTTDIVMANLHKMVGNFKYNFLQGLVRVHKIKWCIICCGLWFPK
jgi:hypothetical protein